MMIKGAIVRIGPVFLLGLLSTGCTQNLKERISLLEDTNATLTEQLNSSRSELDASYRGRQDVARRLAAAMREADDLRAQLVHVPAVEETAPGWTSIPGGAMIAIEGSVLFAPGKTVLRDKARRALEGIVSAIAGEYAVKDIVVIGHTDDLPIKKSGWQDNWQLSTERALAVVRYLRDQDVETDRLLAAGCGEHRPRVPSRSKSDRATNRRVEIFAIDSGILASRP